MKVDVTKLLQSAGHVIGPVLGPVIRYAFDCLTDNPTTVPLVSPVYNADTGYTCGTFLHHKLLEVIRA